MMKGSTMTDPSGLFGQPIRSTGAKLEDMEGHLVLFRPTKLDKGPKYQAPGEFVDRITADVVVFNTDGSVAEEHSDSYFSQAGLMGPLKNAMKEGNSPYVLGWVRKYPSKASVNKGIDTPEKLEAALQDWLKKGGKGEKPQFAWSLADHTPEDVVVATAYIQSKSPVAANAE
jgi:hypothetical protein